MPEGYPKSQSTSPASSGGGWLFIAAILLFLVVWFVGVWVVQAIWG